MRTVSFLLINLLLYEAQPSMLLSNEWISLTTSEALDYYTSYELCRLVKGDSCNTEPGNELGHIELPWPYLQLFNSDHRAYFKRHSSTQPWPKSKTFGDLFKAMHTNGANTIFFIGDSITNLHMGNAHETARRESFDVFEFETEHFPGFQSIEISVPTKLIKADETAPSLQIHFMDLAGMNYPGDFSRKLDSTRKQIDDQVANIKGKALFVINLGLHFQLAYDTLTTSETRLQELKDLAVTNYKKLMGSFLPFFIAYAEAGHCVVFRESSALHYPTPYGLFDMM